MTIARKPKKPSEEEVTKLIEKGGSVPKQKTAKKNGLKNVQLRLSENIISDIDNVRQQDIVAPSRHAWILAAIKEKIGRDIETTS